MLYAWGSNTALNTLPPEAADYGVGDDDYYYWGATAIGQSVLAAPPQYSEYTAFVWGGSAALNAVPGGHLADIIADYGDLHVVSNGEVAVHTKGSLFAWGNSAVSNIPPGVTGASILVGGSIVSETGTGADVRAYAWGANATINAVPSDLPASFNTITFVGPIAGSVIYVSSNNEVAAWGASSAVNAVPSNLHDVVTLDMAGSALGIDSNGFLVAWGENSYINGVINGKSITAVGGSNRRYGITYVFADDTLIYTPLSSGDPPLQAWGKNAAYFNALDAESRSIALKCSAQVIGKNIAFVGSNAYDYSYKPLVVGPDASTAVVPDAYKNLWLYRAAYANGSVVGIFKTSDGEADYNNGYDKEYIIGAWGSNPSANAVPAAIAGKRLIQADLICGTAAPGGSVVLNATLTRPLLNPTPTLPHATGKTCFWKDFVKTMEDCSGGAAAANYVYADMQDQVMIGNQRNAASDFGSKYGVINPSVESLRVTGARMWIAYSTLVPDAWSSSDITLDPDYIGEQSYNGGTFKPFSFFAEYFVGYYDAAVDHDFGLLTPVSYEYEGFNFANDDLYVYDVVEACGFTGELSSAKYSAVIVLTLTDPATGDTYMAAGLDPLNSSQGGV